MKASCGPFARLELACGDEGGRLTNVELFCVDGDGQMVPAVAQLACDRQADDAAADHGDGRSRLAPAHVAFERVDIVGDDAGTSEAQRYVGAAMSRVVNQKLGSVAGLVMSSSSSLRQSPPSWCSRIPTR
jgi:hypothetical protein